ncbi:MAG TPA: hypothetical protein VF505_16015 [Thermoanaerobaculia bacterium]
MRSARFWKRGMIGWAAMAAAMSVNGVVRELAIKPRVGETAAGVVSAATGITLIQLIACRSLRRAPEVSTRQVSALAIVWLTMTLAFEFSIGRLVDKKSWSELLENYNVLEGRLWPVVLATLVAAPFLWSRTSRD